MSAWSQGPRKETGSTYSGPLHPVEVVLQFVECINRQDHAQLVSMLSDDHTYIDLAGEVQRGKALVRRHWAEYFDQCRRYLIHVSEVYLVEDEVVLVGRTTGAQADEPRHMEIRKRLIWVARVRGQYVAEWTQYEDTPENRQFVGADLESRYTR